MADQASVERIAVGDHVRLKDFTTNQHQTYQVTNEQFAFRREAINGLVLSIRDVKTGRLVAATEGDLDNFVFELVFDNTFNAKFASLRNAPRGADRVTATPGWRRIRAALRDLAEKDQLLSTSTAGFLTDSPLAKLLDGWKVIKVRSGVIDSLEQADAAPEAAE